MPAPSVTAADDLPAREGGSPWWEIRFADGASFEDRWKPEEVQGIRVPPDAPPHAPLVLSPGGLFFFHTLYLKR